MAIEKHIVTINTVGSAGSATGSGLHAVPFSELVAVHYNYNASMPSTTDVTLTLPGNPAEVVALTVTNANTDAWFRPRNQNHDNVGAAITGSYDKYLIHRNLLLEIAQADALTDALIATIYVRV